MISELDVQEPLYTFLESHDIKRLLLIFALNQSTLVHTIASQRIRRAGIHSFRDDFRMVALRIKHKCLHTIPDRSPTVMTQHIDPHMIWTDRAKIIPAVPDEGMIIKKVAYVSSTARCLLKLSCRLFNISQEDHVRRRFLAHFCPVLGCQARFQQIGNACRLFLARVLELDHPTTTQPCSRSAKPPHTSA